MAVRKRDQLDAILKAIEKLDTSTLNTARRIIETVGADDIEKLRMALFQYLLPVAEVGAASAAEIGAMAYNAWREEDLGEKIETVAVSAYDEGKYMSAINAAVKKAERGGTVDEMIRTLSGRVGYTSRTSYSGSLFENGRRDRVKPKFARCPASGEACQFCLMLASRGFEYSKGKLGEKVHNHDNCQCTYTCSWDKRPEAQGYSAEKYYAEWKASIEKEAEERAERKGTTVAEERAAIMQRYSSQATRSKAEAKQREKEAEALSPRYLNNQTKLYRNLKSVKPLEGYEDVAIHSDGWSFSYTDANGDDDARRKDTDVSVKELANMLRDNPNYNGGQIRLIACSSGKFEGGAAQQLADELGVKVLAPDRDVFVFPDGKVILARNDVELDYIVEGKIPETGLWNTFEPRAKG